MDYIEPEITFTYSEKTYSDYVEWCGQDRIKTETEIEIEQISLSGIDCTPTGNKEKDSAILAEIYNALSQLAMEQF